MTPCLDKLVAFKLSDIGEGIREVVVKEWYVKPGDKVEQFDNLCEVQSDKASVTITSRYEGKITKLHYKVDDIALVGQPLLDFDVEDDGEDNSDSSSDSDNEKASTPVVETKEEVATEKKQVLCTPSVRKMAKENNIDLTEVPGTGKQGRVLKGDVLEFLGQVPAGTNKPHPTLVQSTPSQAKQVPVAADRVEPLKGVRKAMLKSMTEALKIPHFAYKDEVDMTNLMKFRDQLKNVAAERGVGKLTFMPFCIKAASIGLTKFPLLNSSLDVEKESIIYKGAHNISVAIDTPQGLVVPNIKNCQNKSIIQIAKDLNDLVERGRVGKLGPADFADGTFTLSNIGVVSKFLYNNLLLLIIKINYFQIGGTYTFPVIMAPQVSIGGMGRTKAVPKFGPNDEIIKAHVMQISWTCDHRVIDGVTIASFSNLWKEYLENPALFVIDQ